jgi:hypothetical protein
MLSAYKCSGIPNHPGDPEYVVRLVGQVITVSRATLKVVKGLPALTASPCASHDSR